MVKRKQYGLLFASILLMDQAFKLLTFGLAERVGSSYDVGLPGELIRFTYIKNTGSAFEALPESQLFYIAITTIVVAGILVGLRYYDLHLLHAPLSIILAGAVSNGIDRIFHGGVIDYLDLGYNMQRFSTINAGDVCLVIGSTWLIGAALIVYVREWLDQRRQSSAGNS